MKKKFYDVGTLLYVRNYKCGAGLVAAIVGGSLAAGGSVAAASINSNTQAQINADNEDLTYRSWNQQTKWMREQMGFNRLEAKTARDWESEQANIARDFNAEQALLERQFQSEEAEKAREWNAVDAQMQRAKDAGLNPALYAGGNMPTSNITAGGAAGTAQSPSAPAAGAVGSPAAGVIPKQAPNLSVLSHLGDIGNTMADIALKSAEAGKVNEDTKSVMAFNEFARELYQSNVEVSRNEAKALYGKYCESMSNLEKIKETVKNLQASTMFMDSQTTAQDIENIYKSQFIAAQINELQEKAHMEKVTATSVMYKLPLELGLIKSQAALNYMQGQYMESAKELNYEEMKKVDKICTLLTTQNKQTSWNLLMDMLYGPRERKASLDQLEYNSDETVMLLKTVSDCLNTIFNGVQAGSTAYGAKKIGDAAKVRQPKPNPIGGFGVAR